MSSSIEFRHRNRLVHTSTLFSRYSFYEDDIRISGPTEWKRVPRNGTIYYRKDENDIKFFSYHRCAGRLRIKYELSREARRSLSVSADFEPLRILS